MRVGGGWLALPDAILAQVPFDSGRARFECFPHPPLPMRQVMAALLVARDFNYECHQGCDIRNFQPTGKSVSALPEGWVVASCLSHPKRSNDQKYLVSKSNDQKHLVSLKSITYSSEGAPRARKTFYFSTCCGSQCHRRGQLTFERFTDLFFFHTSRIPNSTRTRFTLDFLASFPFFSVITSFKILLQNLMIRI